jgi:acyl-CoA synthetase (AMP-forming)/AMP-acid ligase II
MSLDDTQVFLPEVWASHARFRADKPAIVCGGVRLTWGELNERCNTIANALLERELGKPARVAVLMSNSADMVAVFLGVMKSGACIVPISTALTPAQIATLLNDSEAVCLIADSANVPLAESALGHLVAPFQGPQVVVDGAVSGWETLADWTYEASTDEPAVRYSLEDDFNIIYSSGTTGSPKGIVQTHRARQHWSYSNALELRMDSRTVALATTPLYSNGTWFMLLPPLFVGATIVIMDSFTPGQWLQCVEDEGVTHSFMVPTQYIGVLEALDASSHDLSSLNYLLSAGSPLRQDTKDAVIARLCSGLFELYGFSEGFATLCRPEEHHKRGSVGTPVVGFDLRIIDDDGNELPPGEVGEIAGYGGGLMKHYHNNPEGTDKSVWRDARGRTFLKSGDIGRVDDDGFLYILDRKKDMILSGGFNIFPKDIEEIVGAHSCVSDVTVIGIPHEKWGETPLALVIPAPGEPLDVDELLGWANERLAKTQRLSGVELRDEFPRNALGKVIKRELRQPYWSES